MKGAGLRLELAGETDPGCVRPNNEDDFAVDEELGLLVVADGMGGHNSGEVASALATKTIREFARKMLGGPRPVVPDGDARGLSARARQLEHFVKSANTVIYEKGRAFPNDAGMGTTVVAALVDGATITVAHVGDSRAYLFRNGRLSALTEDHSLVGDQVRRGLISAADASRSSLQNILTRALGAEKDVDVDVAEHPLLPGDVLLLASDGLMKMVDDEQVARTVAQSSSARGVVESLIAQARAAGGIDNVTIVAARAVEGGGGQLKGIMSRFFGGR
jgi:PPM family protein phosphatase